jgi:hypothetical protein
MPFSGKYTATRGEVQGFTGTGRRFQLQNNHSGAASAGARRTAGRRNSEAAAPLVDYFARQFAVCRTRAMTVLTFSMGSATMYRKFSNERVYKKRGKFLIPRNWHNTVNPPPPPPPIRKIYPAYSILFRPVHTFLDERSCLFSCAAPSSQWAYFV